MMIKYLKKKNLFSNFAHFHTSSKIQSAQNILYVQLQRNLSLYRQIGVQANFILPTGLSSGGGGSDRG